MTKQYKIFSAISILLILILAAWGLFFNHGYVTVQSVIGDFNLKINNQNYSCNNTCTIKLKPGSYTLDLTAKGYTSYSQKIYLLKNESETVDYNPVKQVEFKLVTEFQTPIIPVVSLKQVEQETNQVVLYNDEIITTFKNPLKDTNIISSPSQNFALLYGVNTQEEYEYHLIDIKQKSKQKISLPMTSDQIKNLKLLNDKIILFESSSKVFSYNSSDKSIATLPILSTNHILDLNNDQYLVLTSRALDKTASIVVNSLNQLTTLGSDNLEQELLQEPDKIYLYDLNTSSYTYLQDLDPKLESPFEFKTVLINQILTPILEANENYYQISK